MNKVKIIYAGLDIETLYLLHNEKSFDLYAVGYLENFEQSTYNPANIVFQILYRLRCYHDLNILEFITALLWRIVKPLSTGVFKKYGEYLMFLSLYKIHVMKLYDVESASEIERERVDLMVVNAWGILSEAVIFAPRLGTVNIHPSLLPRYRGALPTLWALKNGDNESAVTYMLLDKGVDTGGVLRQYRFPIVTEDDWLALEDKVSVIVKQTLISDLKKYLCGNITPVEQDNRIASVTERYSKYLKIDIENELAADIHNKVNLYPYLEPGVYCFVVHRGYSYHIKNTSIVEKKENTIKRSEIKRLALYLYPKDGVLRSNLFLDISFFESVRLLLLGK